MMVYPRTQTCEVSVGFKSLSTLDSLKVQDLIKILSYRIHRKRLKMKMSVEIGLLQFEKKLG